MKGKVLTSWSLIWLAGDGFARRRRGAESVSARLSQDAADRRRPWVQKADGIYAEKVIPGLAASRAGISPGDKLIGIGLDGDKTSTRSLRPPTFRCISKRPASTAI